MNEPENKTGLNGEEGNLLKYLVILAKHSRAIIFYSIVVTVLTYLILLILPNKYTAITRVLPPQQNLTLSGQILDSLGGKSISSAAGGGGMGGMAASLLGLKTPGALYVGIMSGDTVFDRIIERFNLMKLYKTKYIEDARKRLAKDTKITGNKNDTIITIEVTGKTPEQVAEIANAFVEELDQLLQQLTLQEAKGRMAFLEKERFQTSQNLQKAEETLRSFSEKNSVLQIDTQIRGALENIARMRADIDAKEVYLQVLRQQATPVNPDMIRLETELKGWKEKLRNAEAQYDNCLSDVCLPANKTPGLALEYVRLYREVKFQEGLYQLYIKLLEIARLDMTRDNLVVQVVDKAKPPQKRSNQRLLPALLAGMLTFFAMVLVSFGRERLKIVNNSEDTIQDLSALQEYMKPWKDMLQRPLKKYLQK
jgi:tyrosine-protein kinase Etk/Wzc